MCTNEEQAEMAFYEEMYSSPEAVTFFNEQIEEQNQARYQAWLDDMDDEERACWTDEELSYEAWLDRMIDNEY